MAKKPSLLDVAERAGVSPATVSRVFNNNSKVNEEMRKKVLEAAEEIGYKTNIYAKALIEGKTNFIGLLLTRFEIRHYSAILYGIESVINKAGYRFFVTSSRYSKEKEMEKINLFEDMKFAGIIIISVGLSDKEILELTKKKPPLLVFDRKVPGYEDNCVYFDYFGFQKAITNLLIENGHRNILHLSGPTNLQVYREKLSGYKQAMEENGFEDHINARICDIADNAEGYKAVHDLMESGEFEKSGITAVNCQNDLLAFGAMCAIREAGLRIPEDVSVTGFGDVPEAAYTTPSLTTVRFSYSAIGKHIGRKMLSILKKEKFDEEVPQFEIIIRNSVKNIKGGDQ
ncbi:MAG TPA: LacI family DNA-binding transcriptional regulator [Thermotogota bacterium]|nr:LacI family DNA-binding transcriptional regulator [Thermotogota bacterium]HPJ88580.1 LacI family DNA-binding transcriptional regulator [Thermotogota bacterium]